MKRTASFWFGFAFLIVAAGALAEDPIEVFTDKGDTFIRAGSDHGLKVGSSVNIVGEKIGNTEERRNLGKASVMEVWPTLARVSLDKAAASAAGDKFAHIVSARSGGKSTKASSPSSSSGPASAPSSETKAIAPAEGSTGGATGGLKGHATFAGVGPEISHKVVIYNDGTKPWSNCELRLPNNKRYVLQKLRAGDSESVMLFKFNQDGAAYDKPTDAVNVKCDEGSARLTFGM